MPDLPALRALAATLTLDPAGVRDWQHAPLLADPPTVADPQAVVVGGGDARIQRLSPVWRTLAEGDALVAVYPPATWVFVRVPAAP